MAVDRPTHHRPHKHLRPPRAVCYEESDIWPKAEALDAAMRQRDVQNIRFAVRFTALDARGRVRPAHRDGVQEFGYLTQRRSASRITSAT